MTTILAYLWTPIIAALLCVGLGLAVERIARWPLPPALLGPVGAAVAIVLGLTTYRLHGTAPVAAAIVGVVALAGFWLARRELGRRLRPGWAGAAALAAYALVIAPSMLTGQWTWAGYNFVNDTSVNLTYVDLLSRQGFTAPEPPFSTTTIMQASGVAQHYPMGAHGLIATLGVFAGVDAAAVYQPVLALMLAGAAAALTQLARRGGAPGPVAAGIGLLAAGANLTYQYSQHGAIKEIAMVLLVVTAAAVVAEALHVGLRPGFGAVLALSIAPVVLVLSSGGAPYALLLVALTVAALVVAPKRPPLRMLALAAGVGLVVTLVATAPVVGDVLSYSRGAATSFEQSGTGVAGAVPVPATLGHLVRPLPATQAAGVWFGGDYRLPVAGTTGRVQAVMIALVLALAAFGFVAQLARRRLGAPLLLATCALTAALVAPRVSPYADAKLLVIAAPAIVLCAGLGAWELWRRRRGVTRALAVALAVACGGAVLASDAIAVHGVRLAPTDRMEALEDAAEHADGGGYWLVNEWEEYSKYFTRAIRNDSGSESESPDVVALRTGGPIFGQYFDLDEQTLEFVQRFDGLIMRRSPVASRPPADFRRAYANDYYEVWRRDRGVRVLDHLPAGGLYDPQGTPGCAGLRDLARKARAAGGELVAATRPDVPRMGVTVPAGRPVGWVPDPQVPLQVQLRTPGRLEGTIRTVEPGRYRAWLQLSSGRPMRVSIDGRVIGTPRGVNSPDQWLEVGELRLDAGLHRVELRRGGGRPLPEDGYEGLLGPLALEPLDAAAPRLERVAPSDAGRLCGGRYDWVEAVAR
jgi:hypothetical protein